MKSTTPAKGLAQRQKKAKQLPGHPKAPGKKATLRPPPTELDAFVFCNCYRKGRLNCPPPNPEIVTVLPNGDLGYYHATPDQHDAFVTWRSHACRHPEGVITAGKVGHTLPIPMVRDALLPHRYVALRALLCFTPLA